jgi:hypothetical protein
MLTLNDSPRKKEIIIDSICETEVIDKKTFLEDNK